MPSIVNGLFAGRGGINSHGVAIAVVGDNISNASTIGYKTARTEFEDLVAGGTGNKIVGSGSSVAAVTTVFQQGTLELTGRDLDLAVDGNGYFTVEDNGARFYTRAGNFKVNSQGDIVTQNGLNVLGFPAGGSGALETLNINAVNQSSVNTSNVTITGNLDAGGTEVEFDNIPDEATALPGARVPLQNTNASATANRASYTTLNGLAEFSTVVEVFDSLGEAHTVTFFFYKDDDNANTYNAYGYVNSEEVDIDGGGNPDTSNPGEPRLIAGSGTPIDLQFNADGTLNAAASTATLSQAIAWNNGSDATQVVNFDFSGFTQYAASSSISGIAQDGQGVGTVTSISVENNGDIFAVLDNGQTSVIGTVGLSTFANPEGLTRVGKQLLQESQASGEPIAGVPDSGTFGSISAGSLELSTTDIAAEFVKLITLQRGFQANSRIITTINQLLNEIINLA